MEKRQQQLDLSLIAGVGMLVLWVGGTVFLEPPGWFHGLLTVGVFLVIMGVVRRGSAARGGR